MAAKTEKKPNSTLPLNTEDTTPSSNITYNSEVVAIIAGLAANEVEGIAGMCNVSGSIMSKNRNVTKGVKVEVGTEEVAVDLYVIVEYGIPIQRAAGEAQENVRKAIESMTGLHVVRVDVHVQSVSFEQDKKALQAGAQQAALVAGETAEAVKLPETEKAEPAPKEKAKAPAAEEVKKPAAEEPEKPAEEAKKPAEEAVKEAPAEKPKAEPKPKAKAAKKAEAAEQKPEEGKAPEDSGEKK